MLILTFIVMLGFHLDVRTYNSFVAYKVGHQLYTAPIEHSRPSRPVQNARSYQMVGSFDVINTLLPYREYEEWSDLPDIEWPRAKGAPLEVDPWDIENGDDPEYTLDDREF